MSQSDAEQFSDGELNEVDLDDLAELNEKDEEELSDKEVTSKIKLSMKRRFDAPTWLTVFEFQNRDGRRADCLAFNTRPARNFKMVGFEFKASRNDWLAEKRDHEKADLFVQLCDEWYVVAGRRGIVEESELPDGWGLLEMKPSGQLWKLVESDLNEMQDKELDRRFYARFMRKAVGSSSNFTTSDIREARRRGYEKAMDKQVDEELDWETRKMRDRAESFEKLRNSSLNLFAPVEDEKIERLAQAKALLDKMESDSIGSLMSRLESIERAVEMRSEDMLEDIDEIKNGIEALKNDVADVGGDSA